MTCDANQFARAVPDSVLNEDRLAEMGQRDLEALEKEVGIGVNGGRNGFWARLPGRG